MASKRDALLKVDLENAFDPNVSPINRVFRIRIKVPRPDALHDIDTQFRAHFIASPVNWDAVTKFRELRGGDGGEDYRACRKVFSRTLFKGVSLCRTCIGTTMDRNMGI